MIGEGSNRAREEESKRERDEFEKMNPVDMEELRCREAGYKTAVLVQVEMMRV